MTDIRKTPDGYFIQFLGLLSTIPEHKKKATIAQLEALLDRENSLDRGADIEILPNGEIRAIDNSTSQERGGRKPLTMREDLGGEYGNCKTCNGTGEIITYLWDDVVHGRGNCPDCNPYKPKRESYFDRMDKAEAERQMPRPPRYG